MLNTALHKKYGDGTLKDEYLPFQKTDKKMKQ